jgi:hypothetical protein
MRADELHEQYPPFQPTTSKLVIVDGAGHGMIHQRRAFIPIASVSKVPPNA